MAGSMAFVQTDMVLEKELRVLHLGVQGAEDTATPGLAWAYETTKTTSIVTHFLQQGHTYSNKAKPPNNAIPNGASIKKTWLYVNHSYSTIKPHLAYL